MRTRESRYDPAICPSCPATLLCACRVDFSVDRCPVCGGYAGIGWNLKYDFEPTKEEVSILDNSIGPAVFHCIRRFHSGQNGPVPHPRTYSEQRVKCWRCEQEEFDWSTL